MFLTSQGIPANLADEYSLRLDYVNNFNIFHPPMDRYALVVGIPTYQSGNFGKLEKTTADAENVAQILEKYGNFRVERLPKRANSDKTGYEMKADSVTFDQLNQALQTFLQRASGKNALIYFTGHGFTLSTKVGREKGFLATSDCQVEVYDDPALGKKVVDQRNGLDLDDFEWLIRKSDLSSLVVLLDCCHSGFFLERRLVEGANLVNTFISKKDYYLITACRSLETAKTVRSQEHSVFSGFLIKGLSEQNADTNGEISGDRLFDFIRREIKGKLQEPIRMGVGDAIVLVKYLIQGVSVDAAVVDAHGEPICPYQGLQPFDEAQKMFFFGRSSLVQQVLYKLNEKRFVPIIGASGSGKSSAVRAGLIPQLKQDDSWQVLTPIKPGIEPLAELRKAFEALFQDEDEVRELYLAIRNSGDGLVSKISSLPGSENYLLVIDQFEELFTVCRDEAERKRFIELITQVGSSTDSRLAIVLTMRADFLEPCLHYPSLTRLIQTQAIYMPPLVGADLEEAITKPAKIQGYRFEDGLLGAILRDVRQEQGILPLLEFALTELWERRDQQNRQLTLAQYQDATFGGVIGALDRHSDKVYLYKDFLKQSPQQKRSSQE